MLEPEPHFGNGEVEVVTETINKIVEIKENSKKHNGSQDSGRKRRKPTLKKSHVRSNKVKKPEHTNIDESDDDDDESHYLEMLFEENAQVDQNGSKLMDVIIIEDDGAATPIDKNDAINAPGPSKVDLDAGLDDNNKASTSEVVKTIAGLPNVNDDETDDEDETGAVAVPVTEELRMEIQDDPENIIEAGKDHQVKLIEIKEEEEEEEDLNMICKLIDERVEAASREEEEYEELKKLEEFDAVPNFYAFDCLICLSECESMSGVVLRECLHGFCRKCIARHVELFDRVPIKCPYVDNKYACESIIQQREIKGILSAEAFEKYLIKSIDQAETEAANDAFHCRTADCPGWCFYDESVKSFQCPTCQKTNCLSCKVIHEGQDCWDYLNSIGTFQTDEAIQKSEEELKRLLANGEAMTCPKCQAIIQKDTGCDGMTCCKCNTDLCWATKGARWGPLGKGDRSGGCGCNVNGRKCHPSCNNCH